MMRRIKILLYGLLMCVGMQAQNIDKVLKSIEYNNIELKAMQKDAEAQYAEIRQQNSLEGLSVEYSPFMRSGVSGISSSELIVSQSFDYPTLYGSRRKLGDMQRKASDLQYSVERRNILLQAELKCLEWIRLNKHKQVLDERLSSANQLLSVFEKRLKHGDVTILEVNKLRIEQMSLRTEQAKNSVAQHEVYQQLVALNANHPLQLEDLTYTIIPNSLQEDSLLLTLLERDVALKASLANEAVALQQIKFSKQSWLPQLSLGYRRNTEGSFVSHGIQIGVSLPLYSNKNKLKAAQAIFNGAQMRTQQTRMSVENELSTQLSTLRQLRASMKVYNLPLMQQSIQLLQKAVNIGEISVINYYIEVDQLYQKWQEYIDTEHRYQATYAELNKNLL